MTTLGGWYSQHPVLDTRGCTRDVERPSQDSTAGEAAGQRERASSVRLTAEITKAQHGAWTCSKAHSKRVAGEGLAFLFPDSWFPFSPRGSTGTTGT